ncbi:MAG: GAF domain-containing sensor histidine kinase [Oculatellaceae cyanobacterium bins.114]|nr:GAF domain-containing sensor histidine kinase [Oculatellaceae cyanobacterium bins.114]
MSLKPTVSNDHWVQGIRFTNQLTQAIQSDVPFNETLQSIIDWLCILLRADQSILFQSINGYFYSSLKSQEINVQNKVTDASFNDFYQLHFKNLTEEQLLILTLFHSDQLPEPLAEWFKVHQVNDAIIFPLVYQEEILGVIGVFSERSQEWSSDELLLAEMVVNQCAIAIHHIQSRKKEVTQAPQGKTTLHDELENSENQFNCFLAETSHELRTPLSAILGFSHVLQQQYYGELNEKQLQYIECISSSGNHLLALVNDILDLAKVEAKQAELDLSEINVFDLCRSCFNLIQEQAQEKGLSLSYKIAPEIHHCLGDSRRVKQILINLLSNAVKFTSIGSVTLQVEHQAQGVSFVVSDTGIGISSEKIPNLFQPFQQLNENFKSEANGTGLGLYLSRRLAQLHGGEITIKSSLGNGSEFTFFLPKKSHEIYSNA